MPARQALYTGDQESSCMRLMEPTEDVIQVRQAHRDSYSRLARGNGYRLNEDDLDYWWPGTGKTSD